MSVRAWLAVAAVVPAALAGVRWLRVIQREHYIPGYTSRFAWRWYRVDVRNTLLALLGAAGIVAALSVPVAAVAPYAVAVVAPIGLGLRGRTSKLVWTKRLIRLAVTSAVIAVALSAVAALVRRLTPSVEGLIVLALPLVVDAAAWLLLPLERRMLKPFVTRAQRRLEQARPRVVAITGSYGKTTTKRYAAHLLSGSFSVVASPASFNNLAGVSRTINELLTDSTQILVAEIGTYGVGEIAQIVAWLKPTVGVITAIGPVHLERFRSLDVTLRAKSEILAGAETAILNVDDPRLRTLADERAASQKVVRCSTVDEAADVVVKATGEVLVRGVAVGSPPNGHFGMNVACAVAIADAFGVPAEVIAQRLRTLPEVEHRATTATTSSGVVVIDDTYNSNPDGAAKALERLAAAAPDAAKRVVVTPGMVELGSEQHDRNADFAAKAGATATDVIVVGRTNRRALLDGLRGTPATVHEVATREAAVAWVRQNLSPGDAVLYENDLPDHYP